MNACKFDALNTEKKGCDKSLERVLNLWLFLVLEYTFIRNPGRCQIHDPFTFARTLMVSFAVFI